MCCNFPTGIWFRWSIVTDWLQPTCKKLQSCKTHYVKDISFPPGSAVEGIKSAPSVCVRQSVWTSSGAFVHHLPHCARLWRQNTMSHHAGYYATCEIEPIRFPHTGWKIVRMRRLCIPPVLQDGQHLIKSYKDFIRILIREKLGANLIRSLPGDWRSTNKGKIKTQVVTGKADQSNIKLYVHIMRKLHKSKPIIFVDFSSAKWHKVWGNKLIYRFLFDNGGQ